jgi:hypothetical protein
MMISVHIYIGVTKSKSKQFCHFQELFSSTVFILRHGLLSEVTSDKPFSNVRFQFVSSRRVPPSHEFVFGNLAIVMGIDTFKYTPGFRFAGKWDPQHRSGILEVDEIDVPVSCHVKGMKEITNIRDGAVYKENESGTIKTDKNEIYKRRGNQETYPTARAPSAGMEPPNCAIYS